MEDKDREVINEEKLKYSESDEEKRLYTILLAITDI